MKSSRPFFLPPSRPLKSGRLIEVYKTLRKAFGHQNWWPGRTPFEVMVGAILTQNTAWANVEKAIRNLRLARKLSPPAMLRTPRKELARLIRPAGYFNVKADRLKQFVAFIFDNYGGSLAKMRLEKGSRLREKLLAVKGIGPETADSILLYALEKPFFVIDAYTKRIFIRHRLQTGMDAGEKRNPHALLAKLDYSNWQNLFEKVLPGHLDLFNDFHAQIVKVGKDFCKSSIPRCDSCPLRVYL